MRTLALLLAAASFAASQDRPAPKLADDLKALLDLANKEREEKKLPALVESPLLTRIARAHAENMARQEKMEHVLDGKGVARRAEEAGYKYRVIGENLARARGEADLPAPPPADIHAQWMKSKRHADNVLNPKFREAGLATARGKSGTIYYAQVFGTPLPPR
jgi:uncharacterized protein YkwD